MGWKKCQRGNYPEKCGTYYVIDRSDSREDIGFFKGKPVTYHVKLKTWKVCMKLESDFADRQVYVKYKAWCNLSGVETQEGDVVYWYELDDLPDEIKEVMTR